MITQALRRTLLTASSLLLLTACAADAPTGRYFMPVSTMAGSTGMVIGTIHYSSSAQRNAGLQRLEIRLNNVTPGAQPVSSHDYALTATVDPARGSGMFSGQLPAGTYRIDAVSTADQTLPMTDVEQAPGNRFEVVAGAVIDIGELRVPDPQQARSAQPIKVSSSD